MLIINYEDCTGCKLCVNNCPFGAMIYEDGRVQVSELCTLCGACANVCRKGAIHIERKQASPEELARYKGVYVWVEFEAQDDGIKPRKVAYELLGKGRALADRVRGERRLQPVEGDRERHVERRRSRRDVAKRRHDSGRSAERHGSCGERH